MMIILRIGVAAVLFGMLMLTMLVKSGDDFWAKLMLAAALLALWCVMVFMIVLAFKKP